MREPLSSRSHTIEPLQCQVCTPLARPFKAQAQNDSIPCACTRKLNQVALCKTKSDEQFGKGIRTKGCDSQQRQFIAPSLCTYTTTGANHQTEFIQLHVMTKNLQNIRMNVVFKILLLNVIHVILIFVWRVKLGGWSDKIALVPHQGPAFLLAGGQGRKGTGTAVPNRLMQHMLDVTCHAYSSRI